uniref:Uncharacterized protein LOC104234750 n=1 Tax=Nicotiana sylvestris TaxID=4096 RepID=A0A1U7X750_NICSY|nr:PREDICTED: uncharacterized protein LOC104234750 [Nicotiana sylvestris]
MIVHGLNIWRHYLYGVSCEVYTDNRSLQHLFKQKNLNLKQQGWVELLKDNDITILYHLGMANVSSLFECIKASKYDDLNVLVHKGTVQRSSSKKVAIGDGGVMQLQDWLCVPTLDGLRELIL